VESRKRIYGLNVKVVEVVAVFEAASVATARIV
jgi:hypothetical protein